MMIKYTIKNTIIFIALLFSGLSWAATDSVAKKDVTPAATSLSSDHAATAVAAPEDPILMLKGITNNVLSALKANPNSRDIYALVDQYILPYVDFNEMSLWVAGKTAWHKASESSRERFVAAFKILVVHTYATALNSYSNEKVDFIPQKIDYSKSRVQISSLIIRPNKENIRLDYRLIRHENQWKVYDIIIEGVSIVQGFQAQFSDEIRRDGLEKVISKIQEHNKTGKGAA